MQNTIHRAQLLKAGEKAQEKKKKKLQKGRKITKILIWKIQGLATMRKGERSEFSKYIITR